ncbi:MAG: bifunctional precorrin-2 dehydrogenase/sirohydrochlorin ferrochelatase [Candidatus Scalinduaceae bacterium]
MLKFYPVYLDVNDKKCVIIGGGNVAYRKACSLREAGADVTVISPDTCPEMTKKKGLTLINESYNERFLDDAMLVIAATDDEEINRKVSMDAGKRNIIVNVVDRPELCSFIVPATVNRGDLCISISTGGASPALARNIRKELEVVFGSEYGAYIDLLTKMRNVAMSTVKDDAKRRRILQRLAEKDILEIVKTKGTEEAEAEMRKIINQ